MSETVRVEFDPPRTRQKTEKSWRLYAEGMPCVSLPKSETSNFEWQGETVSALKVSKFISDDRELDNIDGVVVCFQETDNYQEEQTNDTMSRDDWFALGITMALVIRGDPALDALRAGTWNGKRLANRVRGIE